MSVSTTAVFDAAAFETNLLWAFNQFTNTDRLAKYTKCRDYYDGLQDMEFATKKFQNAFGSLFKTFSYNRCAPVIDAITDRLQLTGFDITSVSAVAGGTVDTSTDTEVVDPYQDAVNVLWEYNRMDKRQGDVHQEMFTCGDAYVIVWPEPVPNTTEYLPQLNVNRAGTVYLNVDASNGRKRYAVKAWKIDGGVKDGFWRLTFYYPDRLEKFITKAKKDNLSKLSADYEPYRPEMETVLAPGTPVEPWPLPNPYGEVPVFWFSNNAWEGEFGRSELRDVIPLQDALNKAGMDLLVAMEYGAYRQRWVTGMGFGLPNPLTGKVDAPFREGPGEIWSGPKDANFGDFEAHDLTQFIQVQNQFDGQISNVARIPRHWLSLSMDNPPSGEALKTADAPFVAKLQDRTIGTGNKWEDTFKLMLKMYGLEDIGKIKALWAKMELRSSMEAVTEAVAKMSVNVPDEQLWTELGYDDDQIAKFRALKAEAVAEAQALFNQGGGTNDFPSGDTEGDTSTEEA